jgi:hypothetical protein
VVALLAPEALNVHQVLWLLLILIHIEWGQRCQAHHTMLSSKKLTNLKQTHV